MTILKLDKVSKSFYTKTQETLAISNLSIHVNKGEFVSIIGPSGCGKTTILSLVAGLIKPTSGKVQTSANGVGYMLQRDHLFEWRTIFANVTLGLEIQRKKNAQSVQYATDLLKKYGLWEFRKHYPCQLSGGMRQRVALIRTLCLNPDLLLLDEPFSALDFQTRLTVCDDVYGIIKSEKKTAVLVTHDISEAVSVADRIIMLTKRPARVKNVYTLEFIGANSPLERREHPDFRVWFERLWRDINDEN